MTILPHIAGLDWTPDGTIFTAPATKPFWDHYYNHSARRPRLSEIGISIKKLDVWHVRFDPAAAFPEVVKTVATELREEAFEEELASSERRAAAEKYQREQQAIRAARHAEREEKRAAAQTDAQALSRECLDRWGLFTAQQAKVRTWVDAHYLYVWESQSLIAAVKETERKAERRKLEPVAVDQAVDWPDDIVEACVLYLTGRDADHGKLQNFEGWDAADTSRGHWVCSMLSIDRSMAIEHARTFIRKYAKRQVLHILNAWRNHGEAP
ncbi:MAG TPA: hypothetical protein VIL30_26410 [Ramlibacter sp.]|jgi:hypothetical protein